MVIGLSFVLGNEVDNPHLIAAHADVLWSPGEPVCLADLSEMAKRTMANSVYAKMKYGAALALKLSLRGGVLRRSCWKGSRGCRGAGCWQHQNPFAVELLFTVPIEQGRLKNSSGISQAGCYCLQCKDCVDYCGGLFIDLLRQAP